MEANSLQAYSSSSTGGGGTSTIKSIAASGRFVDDGSTITTESLQNVSSITREAAGRWLVTFTEALSSGEFVCGSSADPSSGASLNYSHGAQAISSTTMRVWRESSSGSGANPNIQYFSFWAIDDVDVAAGGGSSTEAVSFASLILDAQLSADASVGVGTVDFDVVNTGSSNYSSGVYTFDLDFEGFVIVNATNTTSSRVAYEVRLDGTRIVRADEQTGGGDGPHALSTLFFTATAGQTLVVHNLVSTSWRGGSDGETYFQLIRTTDTTSDTLTLNSTTSSLTIDNTYINEVIESESASAINITVDDAHGFSKGQWVQFNQIGAGQISFVASGSQNLQAADASNKTRVQYSSAMLLYRDNNNWLLTGDITT